MLMGFLVCFLKILFIYLSIFREREGREGEREKHQLVAKEKQDAREKHQLIASSTYPDWEWNCNPGMCPDWLSNQQPLLSGMTSNQLSHIGQGNGFVF